MKESRPVPGQVAVVRCDVPDDKPYYCVTSEGWGPEHPMPEGERYWVPLPDFCEPAEPDEPGRVTFTQPSVTTWTSGYVQVECPDCAKYRRLSAEKDNILRSVNEEKDSEIRHLYGMLRQAAEECTGCASLRGELAHCESALIDCQENAEQPSVEDYNEEVSRVNAANMVAAEKYNAMVDKNNSGQGKKLDKILALLKTWEPK